MGTDGATYADQQKVFDELGQGVLKNAYEGFNSCLFAYGQTGSGKSYSMVGYGVNKGIVPIACDEIFKAIELKKSDKFQFQVTIQMLEIYNEQVRDLFAKSTPAGGLKVRMNPKSGVEVVGLTEWPVGSYKEIDERIETATKNRTVAATQMNATSSRAHTVVTITYTQLEINAKGPGKHSEKKAKMNLVDLAGSERAESTGATGDRLKEGAAINLSLTMLGNVITALAEKSNNPNKKVLVPYRDSKLTCILQDALGGNAKTIMICALSPADINYEETLGTLRYADRAKQIKNKPKVNVDPTELLIQQLKAENERLKAMGGAGEPTMVGMSEEEKEAMRKQMEQEMASKMADNERMMAEMSKSWEEKLKEAQALAQTDKEAGDSDGARKAKEAHILNIHEDPVLSRAICYFFPPGQTTTVGNRAHPAGEDILLGGVSIRAQHCKIASEGAGLALSVRTDEKCKVVLNGKEVAGDGIALRHNDRLMLGSNYYFVVVNPPEAGGAPEGGWPDVDWDYFQREIAKEQGLDMDVNWASMSEEEKRRALLNDELVQVMPRVTEANDLSGAMQRGIAFETRITPVMSRTEGMVSVVMVKVTNASTGHVFMWDKAKFINRVYLMREQYEKFEQGEIDLATLEPENDPFWDPNEPMQVGQATVFLKPLAYCMTVSPLLPSRTPRAHTPRPAGQAVARAAGYRDAGAAERWGGGALRAGGGGRCQTTTRSISRRRRRESCRCGWSRASPTGASSPKRRTARTTTWRSPRTSSGSASTSSFASTTRAASTRPSPRRSPSPSSSRAAQTRTARTAPSGCAYPAAAPRRLPAPRARREAPRRRGALSGRWRQTGVISGTSNPTFNFKQQVRAWRRGARGGAGG